MALFRKKTDDDNNDDNGSEFIPQPDKAQRWFEHARVAADSSNFDYALQCYATGLKLDPQIFSAHKAMFEAAVQYSAKGGKPASGKEIRAIDGSHTVERMIGAEFAWMKDLQNGALSLKFLEAVAKCDELGGEVGRWHAPRVLSLLRRGKKTKSNFVKAMEAFRSVGAFNEALAAGNEAVALDPSGDIAAYIKDISAERAISQGGYAETAGEEGGFRKNIKNADKQREIEEQESLSGTATTEERNLLRAKKDYDENPVPENINKYAQLLKKVGTPDSVAAARQVYLDGFESTGEYRFRMNVGALDIEIASKGVRRLEEALEDNPDDAAITEQLAEAKTVLAQLQSSEYRQWARKYPTNRQIKFDLGIVELELKNFEAAMECFQGAKDEPKLTMKAGHMLGRCFAAEGWHQEAIGEYDEAIAKIDATTRDLELDINYDLMLSLIEHARVERSIEFAKRAADICAGIVRKNITYRDIRKKRKEVDGLIKELSGGSASHT